MMIYILTELICLAICSSMVLRSQSFHSGATMLRQGDLMDDESNPGSHTRWTTESSDEEF